MKKLICLAVATVALAFTSCKVDLNKIGGELIDPSDNIITKEYKLTAFEEVDMIERGDSTTGYYSLEGDKEVPGRGEHFRSEFRNEP